MTNETLTVDRFMTHVPHSIGIEQTLAKAHRIMHEHAIRHLPVLRGGKLVGILSDRDLRLVEALRDVDPTKVLVEDAMSSFVYAVPPTAPLEEVVAEMGARRYGSAVVMDRDKVVGILTTVDVCNAFAKVLARVG
jgi:acetoin utilization protein AcuB